MARSLDSAAQEIHTTIPNLALLSAALSCSLLSLLDRCVSISFFVVARCSFDVTTIAVTLGVPEVLGPIAHCRQVTLGCRIVVTISVVDDQPSRRPTRPIHTA